MNAIIRLEPGRLYAGMNLPFFLPESMIEGKLRMLGLKNFVWFRREDASPHVDPKSDPLYTDDWNRWVEADCTAMKNVEEAKVWSWLVIVPTPSRPSQ